MPGSDKGETAARCRAYVRDEQKIAVIFDMMKRKCVKTDSDRGPLAPNIGTPNIVNVPQNSLPVSTVVVRYFVGAISKLDLLF